MNTHKDWQVLSPYEHCRLRTEVVFGSRDPHTQTVLEYHPDGPRIVETTWVPAVFTAFRELLDNALDEVITHGHGNRIDVTYDEAEVVFSVADNGRGIPIEWSDEHQKHAATVLLSEMNSGRNFIADRGETRGLNGIGAKGVNFCSEWFDVDVQRDKKHFVQRFSEGPELQISEPTVTPITSRKTGTTIRCKLSPKVFPDRRLPTQFVEARMHEIAGCYPNLNLTFNGTPIAARKLFGDRQPITFSIDEADFKAKFHLVPDFVKDGEFSFSLVNAIPLFNGGAHIDAFRRGFHSGLLSALERENKKRRLTPNRSDVGEGLLLYGVLEMTAPNFDSQSKTRLINQPVGVMVRKMIDDPEFFKGIIKKYPDWINSIYARCAERTHAKDSKEASKQAKKNLRQKIEDLEDACGVDRTKCVLFITEGKSACASITEARDASVHGALPMRGKILNVHGEPPSRALSSEALANVMGAVGLIPGQRANRHTLRYGAVYLAADADPDGRNVASLLINLFYRYWPELFDPSKPAFVNVLDTPLIIAIKGKNRKYWYNNELHRFNPDTYANWEIVRAKGLAALTREDWATILVQPRLTPIVDDGHLAEALSLIFSQEKGKSDARKDWIGM